MSKIKEATVSLIAPKYRARKDGTISVQLRVIFNREKREYALNTKKYNTTAKEFMKCRGRMFVKDKDMDMELEALKNKANGIVRELGEKFTFHLFEEKMFNQQTAQTVFEFLTILWERFESHHKIGTARPYRNLHSSLLEYRKGRTTLKFEDISVKFLENYERHLKDKDLRTSTISIYLRTLRSTFNKAISEGLTNKSSYPFSDFTIKSGSSRKLYFTRDQIRDIISYPYGPDERLKDHLNFIALSYYLRGMNFTDMCQMTWDENIVGDRLYYIRQKTANAKEETEINIQIKPHIREILDQYKHNHPYILPVLEPGLSAKTTKHRIHGKLKQINKDLKRVAEELNIPDSQRFTFYHVRHTYANVQATNSASTEQISQALGHKDIMTTKNYLKGFDNSVIDALDDNL
ncbi:MAG: site-specific integrase [bacterium]|nr:site-specific integrase [bacterium]